MSSSLPPDNELFGLADLDFHHKRTLSDISSFRLRQQLRQVRDRRIFSYFCNMEASAHDLSMMYVQTYRVGRN